jgi:hypothetical protein
MANKKESNDWIRKAARAGLTAELTHSEMNDLIRGKKTVEELRKERAPADRKLTTEDIIAIAKIADDQKVGWIKARRIYLTNEVDAQKQHPMSQAIRIMAGKQPKPEQETDEEGA